MRRFLPIRGILSLLALVSLMSVSYRVLLPVLAKNVLHGNARTQGFLMGASGLGALCGALYLGSRRSVRGLGAVIVLAGLLFGSSLIALGCSQEFWLSLPLMFLTGLGWIVQVASGNTIIQTVTDDDKRGRVMSFYTMSLIGMAPFGSLLAGSLADSIGTPRTLMLCGAVCLVGTLAFLRMLPAIRRVARPIYVAKGVIPEVARGLRTSDC